MKLNSIKKQAGLTLIEITLVIAVLLGLISVLFIGVSAYKEGSDRAKCILNISAYQKAVRSYQNLYDKAADSADGSTTGDALDTADIVGEGKFLEAAPTCPRGGTYTPASTYPAVGTAALVCEYADTYDHKPQSTAGW